MKAKLKVQGQCLSCRKMERRTICTSRPLAGVTGCTTDYEHNDKVITVVPSLSEVYPWRWVEENVPLRDYEIILLSPLETLLEEI